MKEKLSKEMKGMTKIYGWVFPVVILYGIALCFLIAAIGVKDQGKNKTDNQLAVAFDAYGGANIYSSVNGQMMSYKFASDFNEVGNYYFVYDEDGYFSVVKIHGDLNEEQLNLQSYLYEQLKEKPDPVMFYGMSAPYDEELLKIAIKSYNAFYGIDYVTENNHTDYIGECYLDTTSKALTFNPFVTCLGIFFVFVIFATKKLITSLCGEKYKNGRATLRAWPKEKLFVLDKQLKQSATLAFEKEQLYLINNYIITNAEGFEIISYGDIIKTFVVIEKRAKKLKVKTKDQKTHTLALVKGGGQAKKERYEEIKSLVNKKIDEKKEEIFDVFKENDYQNSLTQMSITSDEPKENLILGIIGAVLGTLLGVILWIILGQVGFIAGLAGYLMLKSALSGYKSFGGVLNKKGAIICLIITVGMIYVANFLTYAVAIGRAYFTYDASLEALYYIFHNFNKLMFDANAWMNFYRDLMIGYGLSVYACYRVIGNIFEMQ